MAHRGRLLVGKSSLGVPVYAAAFLRDRKIILEGGLLCDPQAFRLILLHELFHFVWRRLGNSARFGFESILAVEWQSGARGELGESSDVMKAQLRQAAIGTAKRRWRNYLCESFCDTAAWMYSADQEHAWFTLRKRWREGRKTWFKDAESQGPWKC